MQGILIDLDGVIYEDGQMVAGADKVVRWLQGQHIPFLFLTNTTSVCRQALVARLAGMGIMVTEQQILTPVVAAARWIERFCPGPVASFLPQASQVDLGLAPQQLLAEGSVDEPACVVVGDLAEQWDFSVMNRAFRLLMADSRPAFLGLGMSRYWRNDGALQLDAGPFIQALEYATGREAWQLGKPVDDFFLAGARLLGSEPGQTLMVGDDMFSDIQGAQQAGMQTLLVRTGKFRMMDMERSTRPDGVLDSIAELPQWFTL